ncbi:protein regulator of cytokinesis 1 [Elysia marginata]|uniref:Protein regulator of cytokinesis 1 n=1 Tax=Elysia marginata TaxID=1093978 RepID=A0AAV4H136_9GAST|nr:protein regulator of cytokinesis 1 [Elysia marginata]
MPVEPSTDAPVVQYRLHASSRRHHPVSQPHHHLLPCCAEDLDLGTSPDDLELCLSSSAAAAAYSAHHLAGDGNNGGSSNTNGQNLISTHSPPLINLSPNLSPSSETFYDFRETTRRRSFHGEHLPKHIISQA